MIKLNKELMKQFICLYCILSTVVWTQNIHEPAHHTKNGFQNPFSTFNSNHEFVNFFKWAVLERIKGEKPEKPDSYHFNLVYNAGEYSLIYQNTP